MNANFGHRRQNRIKLLTEKPFHIKLPNQAKGEEDNTIIIRKKMDKRDFEIKSQIEVLKETKSNGGQKQIQNLNEKESKKSDNMSLEYSRHMYKKKTHDRKSGSEHKSKPRYYIIDEHGDNKHIKQKIGFSNESLECMEIMKAAIRDVVHEKISEITLLRFKSINDRLDNMASLIMKNEIAVEESVKDLREKLNKFREDTSSQLKQLYMKLEYGKLIPQTFNTCLTSDTTQQQSASSGNPSHYVQNRYYPSGQNSLNYQTPLTTNYCNRNMQFCENCCNTNTNNNPIINKNKFNTNNLHCPEENNLFNLSEGAKNENKSNNHFSDNSLIPDILNNFIKQKLNYNKKQTSSNVSNDKQNISMECNPNEMQDNLNKMSLREILNYIQEYYEPQSLSNDGSKSNLNIKIDDEENVPTTDDIEDTEESKSSSDEYEETYCNSNE